VTRIAAAALWAVIAGSSGSGCIEIDGGAVELSWSLRSFDGAAVTCGDARVEEMRLCWVPLADGSTSAGGGACSAGQLRGFPCEESSGVTGFELDPGVTAFWIEPVCRDGDPAEAGTYQVPPPIVRSVQEGRIVSLNSLLLVVSPPSGECSGAGCTCVRP
jgi:hypothetical protein